MRRTKMKSCGLTELIVSAYTLCGLGGIIVVEQAYEKKFGTWVITNLLWGLAGGTFAASNLVLALRVWVSGTLERQVDELTDAVSQTKQGAELLQMDERRIKGTCEALRRSVRALKDNTRRYKLTNLFKLALMADVDLDGTVSIKEFTDMEKFMETQFHIRASDIQATKDLIVQNGYVSFDDVKRIFKKHSMAKPEKNEKDEHGRPLPWPRPGSSPVHQTKSGLEVEEKRQPMFQITFFNKPSDNVGGSKKPQIQASKYFDIKRVGEAESEADPTFEQASLGAEVQNLDSAIVVMLRIICLLVEEDQWASYILSLNEIYNKDQKWYRYKHFVEAVAQHLKTTSAGSVFRTYDTDRSGCLNPDELKHALMDIKYNHEMLVKEKNSTKKGIANSDNFAKSSYNKLKRRGRRYENDDSGTYCCGMCGHDVEAGDLNELVAKNLIAKFDTNKDGFIDETEFNNMIKYVRFNKNFDYESIAYPAPFDYCNQLGTSCWSCCGLCNTPLCIAIWSCCGLCNRSPCCCPGELNPCCGATKCCDFVHAEDE